MDNALIASFSSAKRSYESRGLCVARRAARDCAGVVEIASHRGGIVERSIASLVYSALVFVEYKEETMPRSRGRSESVRGSGALEPDVEREPEVLLPK